MAFGSMYDDELLLLGDNSLVMGTAMLGTEFGSIDSASVKRTADKEEIDAAGGNVRAVVLKKLRLELVIEAIFDTSVEAPGILDTISFPFEGLVGHVLEAEIKWERGKERLLTINATVWDALGEAPAYSYDPVTGVYTPLNQVLVPLELNSGGNLELNSGEDLEVAE
jgi:hypothetical protein